MNKSKILAFFAVLFLSLPMLMVSDDAEAARRLGGGFSIGRQSSKVTKPATPIMRNDASSTAGTAAAPSAMTGANRAGMPNAQPRSGFSRFLGPIAGIAAGLGIAALLSSLGLSGVFLEFMSSLVLIGLVVFGVMFILRRLRGVQPAPAGASKSGASDFFKSATQPNTSAPHSADVPQSFRTGNTTSWNTTSGETGFASPASTVSTGDNPSTDDNWFIPAGFDTHAFLQEAKKQFVLIQSLWDAGDINRLHQYLTDDLVKEITAQITEQAGQHKTEVVLLNAELLGMEKIKDHGFDGHLASVRFSGMLREEANQPAFRFEEVWNLYKSDNSGWLLAGIQQIPVQN
ncbi:Tim44 domain-containing protein [Pelistega europaea]|uniref:TIM44-like domain-containing protein n=1 Tax=Pelistega europaea TaxID=106147 RepID=A0A7Y4P5S6_9BURK|nr:TIM44-like domain-containing protein [Pelistega europaea]NOL49169.1 TIM44-like domain-containing protein [Pelistega europaea]